MGIRKHLVFLYYYGARVAKLEQNKYLLYSRAVNLYSEMNDQEKKKYFREKQIERAVQYVERYYGRYTKHISKK